MHGRLVGSVLMILAGLAAAWAGLAGPVPAIGDARLPVRMLPLVAAAALVTVGVWLCWHGAGLLVRPPAPAGRVVSVLAAGALGALAITAVFVAIQELSISW